MGSKSKRRAARLKRQRAARQQPTELDPHVAEVIRSIEHTERWLSGLLSTDAPGAHAHAALKARSDELAASLQQYDEFELCELLRVTLLPWSIVGEVRPGTER